MRIKVGDVVQVITGNDRNSKGKVLKVDRDAGKLIVEGINRVYKHVRRSQRNPQGGRLSKEMPIQLSNVQLICPKCNRPTRVGARTTDDGTKHRTCRKCDSNIDQIAPPKVPAQKRS